jgi:DNA-binding GntR family transcriptional regulator
MLRAASMTQPGCAGEAIAEIGEIVRAIEARDGAAAAAACAYHVQQAGHYALITLGDEATSEPPPGP